MRLPSLASIEEAVQIEDAKNHLLIIKTMKDLVEKQNFILSEKIYLTLSKNLTSGNREQKLAIYDLLSIVVSKKQIFPNDLIDVIYNDINSKDEEIAVNASCVFCEVGKHLQKILLEADNYWIASRALNNILNKGSYCLYPETIISLCQYLKEDDVQKTLNILLLLMKSTQNSRAIFPDILLDNIVLLFNKKKDDLTQGCLILSYFYFSDAANTNSFLSKIVDNLCQLLKENEYTAVIFSILTKLTKCENNKEKFSLIEKIRQTLSSLCKDLKDNLLKEAHEILTTFEKYQNDFISNNNITIKPKILTTKLLNDFFSPSSDRKKHEAIISEQTTTEILSIKEDASSATSSRDWFAGSSEKDTSEKDASSEEDWQIVSPSDSASNLMFNLPSSRFTH